MEALRLLAIVFRQQQEEKPRTGESRPQIPIKEIKQVWQRISYDLNGASFSYLKTHFDAAQRNCLSLLETNRSETPPLTYLNLKDADEWKVFYIFLLERFIMTDPEVGGNSWKQAEGIIDQVRWETMRSSDTLPADRMDEWLAQASIAVQFIVLEYRRDEGSKAEKMRRIGEISKEYGQTLAEIHIK